MTTARAGAAVEYAKRGIKVFPVHEVVADKDTEELFCSCDKGRQCLDTGKHPRTEDGFESATNDPEVVAALWTRWPNANIGMPTGKVNNVAVIDADGEVGLATLEERGYSEKAPRVRTGSGGVHVYAAYPDDLDIPSKVKAYGPGIDTRGKGGYVLLPPSNHISGRGYEWERELNGHVPDAPGWLRKEVLKGAEKMSRAEPLPETIAEGGRNSYIYSYACTLRARGLTEGEILEAIRLLNASRCEPPLEEDELRSIAGSAAKRAPGDKLKEYVYPGAGNGLPGAPEFPVEAMPAATRQLIREAAAAISCPPEFIAVPMLTTLAGAIGNSVVFEVNRERGRKPISFTRR